MSRSMLNIIDEISARAIVRAKCPQCNANGMSMPDGDIAGNESHGKGNGEGNSSTKKKYDSSPPSTRNNTRTSTSHGDNHEGETPRSIRRARHTASSLRRGSLPLPLLPRRDSMIAPFAASSASPRKVAEYIVCDHSPLSLTSEELLERLGPEEVSRYTSKPTLFTYGVVFIILFAIIFLWRFLYRSVIG